MCRIEICKTFTIIVKVLKFQTCLLSTVNEFNVKLHDAIPHDRIHWPVHDLGCLEIPAKILAFPNQLPGHSFSLIEKKQWYNGAAFIKSKIRMIWDVWRYRPRYWISDQCSQLLVRTCSSIENKQWSKQSQPRYWFSSHQ